jgi:hypothetical protein
MSYVDLSEPTHISRPPVARATVTKAPLTGADSMWVTPIGYSTATPYEVRPSNWLARGSTLPAVGALCVVIFDNLGDAWVPMWGAVHSE